MADNVRNLIVHALTQYHNKLKAEGNLLPSHSAADSGKILSVNSSGQTVWINRVSIYSGDGVPNNSQGNNGDIYLQTE